MKLLLTGLLFALSLNSYAGVEYKKFDTPEQEQAYKILIEELRCLVCQNQTIADSNAELAQDLRRQVYEMLQQGKSREEIADFMTQRYGDFVLYNPPFKVKTGVLWLGPVVFLFIGLVVLILYGRKKKLAPEQSLTEQENQEQAEKKAKARALLNKEES